MWLLKSGAPLGFLMQRLLLLLLAATHETTSAPTRHIHSPKYRRGLENFGTSRASLLEESVAKGKLVVLGAGEREQWQPPRESDFLASALQAPPSLPQKRKHAIRRRAIPPPPHQPDESPRDNQAADGTPTDVNANPDANLDDALVAEQQQQQQPSGRRRANAADAAPWLQYLTPRERARVNALRPGHNEYKRLGLGSRERRAAWLAGDSSSGGGGGGQQSGALPGSRRALFQKLKAAHNEYHRLYRKVLRELDKRRGINVPPGGFAGWGDTQAQAAAAEAQAAAGAASARAKTKSGAPPGEGQQPRGAGAPSQSPKRWAEYLTPKERARVKAVRPSYNEYMRLGLSQVARREMWLAQDDASGRRRTYWQSLQPAVREYYSLYRKAARIKEELERKAAEGSTTTKGDALEAAEKPQGAAGAGQQDATVQPWPLELEDLEQQQARAGTEKGESGPGSQGDATLFTKQAPTAKGDNASVLSNIATMINRGVGSLAGQVIGYAPSRRNPASSFGKHPWGMLPIRGRAMLLPH